MRQINKKKGNIMINKINGVKFQRNLQQAKPSQARENLQVDGKYSSVPYNNSYAVAFLGKKDYTQNEKEFVAFKTNFYKKLHKLATNDNLARWNFYIDSSEENKILSTKAVNDYLDTISDKETFEKLKEFDAKGINDATLKKRFDKLYKDFERNVSDAEDIKKLEEIELSVGQKMNGYRGKVDGVEYSNTELDHMLDVEKDPAQREKIFRARYVDNGDMIAPDLINMVKARNEFAKKKGFDNYYSYRLSRNDYKVDETKFFELLEELNLKSSGLYEKLKVKEDKELAELYGIKPEDLKAWHYGIKMKDSASGEIDKYFKDNDTMVNFAKKMYKNQGFDVDKMPITLDLFARQNKNQHGYCNDVNKNKDVRILANLRNDLSSAETLIHELGHSVYDLGVSDHLAFEDRDVASPATTEAVAMLNETLPKREKAFIQEFGISEELAEKLEVERQTDLVHFVKKYTPRIMFEREMYRNPDQDLTKLCHDLEKKYRGRIIPESIGLEYASVPHYISHPAYLPNYVIAETMASQMYEKMHADLGDLTKNPNTAKYFNQKLFRFGATLSPDELIKKITGKELSAEAFCKQFEALAKHLK